MQSSEMLALSSPASLEKGPTRPPTDICELPRRSEVLIGGLMPTPGFRWKRALSQCIDQVRG
jgi:hypothetical protein